MKVEESTTAVPAARRHIIRRPRLTRMLDESGARIILLVAPAGYGKTTLARQWLEEGSRRAAWYHCNPASADVAAAAVGLSTASTSLLPEAGERLAKRLRATRHPEEEVRELAEILAEDLQNWPSDAWLVVDDYHFAVSSGPTEHFVQQLLGACPVQVLVAGRRRPAWASARQRTYGEILEVDRTLLSMTDDEALAVLGPKKNVRPLLKRAQGWPAVIGMAALTGGEDSVPDEQLPATLYDYIAEELYEAANNETRWGLCQLAIAESVTIDLGMLLLGDRLETVLEHGTRLGIAVERPRTDVIELHPLLRRFLREKIYDFDQRDVEQAVSDVAKHLLEMQRWDDAFEIAKEFGSLSIFEQVVNAALSSLLAAGRVSTVQKWVDFAAERLFRAPILDFAEAELSVRQGLHAKAETLALQAAAKTDAPWRASALTRAGRAAHLHGRPKDAIRDHRLALEASPSEVIEREALWGLLVALVEIEDINAADDALAALDSKAVTSVDDMLRVASGRLLISVRGGQTADASPLINVLPLVERCQDPMARTSFLNSCAIALTLNGRYGQAHAIAAQLITEAEEFRLRFVLPYGFLRMASVAAGKRRFGEAYTSLERAEALAAEVSDRWMSDAIPAIRAMVHLSAGEADRAVRTTQSAKEGTPSIRAEVLGVQALALACTGDTTRARTVANEARSTSLTLEAASLSRIADAVAACVLGNSESRHESTAAFHFALERGTADHFVTAYRAFPSLIEALASDDNPQIARIMKEASDEDLARQTGVVMPRPSDALTIVLSPREREVFELMASGLTNKAIASKLFISESTTKVHLRHIFEKLDARTRTEAVRKGRERLANGD